MLGQSFHISTQHDSLVAADLARAAQLDSYTMKTISVLGLLFLPGTFISVRSHSMLIFFKLPHHTLQTVFSMSFFSFSPGTDGQAPLWTVSKEFWIYWVIAVPLTVLTIVSWNHWQNSLPTQATTRGQMRSKVSKKDVNKIIGV